MNFLYKSIVIVLSAFIICVSWSCASDSGVMPVDETPEIPPPSIAEVPKTMLIQAQEEPEKIEKPEKSEKIEEKELQKPVEKKQTQKPSNNGFYNTIKALVKTLLLILVVAGIYLLYKKIKSKKPSQKLESKEFTEPETISEAVSSYVRHRLRRYNH